MSETLVFMKALLTEWKQALHRQRFNWNLLVFLYGWFWLSAGLVLVTLAQKIRARFQK